MISNYCGARRQSDGRAQQFPFPATAAEVGARTNCSFKVCDLADPGAAEAAKLEPESFDFIIARNTIEHMQRPVETLRAARTLLRSDGNIHSYSAFLIGDSPMTDSWDRFLWAGRIDARDRGAKTPLLVPRYMQDAGFTVSTPEQKLHTDVFTELLGKSSVMLCSKEIRAEGFRALREQLEAFRPGSVQRLTLELKCIGRNRR